MTADYVLTALIVVLIPGTGVIYTIAVGLGRGWQASLLAAIGCTLGTLPHAAAGIAGLAALLHASAVAFQVVKILGVAWLLWTAWQMWKAGGNLSLNEAPQKGSGMGIIGYGIALNLLNPKLSLFFLAFLPQFVSPNAGNPTEQMISLALMFMGLTLAVFAVYGACASAARRYVVERPGVMKWLQRSFAAAFSLLALRLAVAER